MEEKKNYQDSEDWDDDSDDDSDEDSDEEMENANH
jgi:hypothetical protein